MEEEIKNKHKWRKVYGFDQLRCVKCGDEVSKSALHRQPIEAIEEFLNEECKGKVTSEKGNA